MRVSTKKFKEDADKDGADDERKGSMRGSGSPSFVRLSTWIRDNSEQIVKHLRGET